jgi:hypothetical protein
MEAAMTFNCVARGEQQSGDVVVAAQDRGGAPLSGFSHQLPVGEVAGEIDA